MNDIYAADGHAYNSETSYLIAQAQSGNLAAREKLAVCNMGLVRNIAARFQNSGKEADDLFQVGCIGLLKAIDRFDINYGVHFSTYAVPLIMGEIRRFLRDDRPISVSRSLKEQAVLIERRRLELRQLHGSEPTVSLLAEECDLTPEQVITATESQRPLLFISELMTRENGEERSHQNAVGSLSVDEREELTERISMAKMLEELPERLSYIVRSRYFEEKTQTEISKELGISQVQVSRLEKKALALIKDKIENES